MDNILFALRAYILRPVLCGLLLLGLAGCQTAGQNDGAASFRVMTYNIHHGEGLDGKVDVQRIAELIRREGADLVALQEVDKGVERTGRRDLPAELAALTGLQCLFSSNLHHQGGEYGNAILTRFPVVAWSNTHLTRQTPGEQRGILRAILRVRGRELVFLDTHLDHQSEAERLRSADEINPLVQTKPLRPVILCGDFNTKPGSPTYQKLAEVLADTWSRVGAGEGFTIPADKPRQRIDYIWLANAKDLVPLRAWVPASEASDHRPVVAEFQFH